MDMALLRRHLRCETTALVVGRKNTTIAWADETFHRQAFAQQPAWYALQAVAPEVQPGQRMRVLFQILESAQAGLSAETQQVVRRVARVLAVVMPADDVLTVFLALRRRRINRKPARRFMLDYLLNHPCLEDLALRRRPAWIDCLEHALGRDTARGALAILQRGKCNDPYVRRNLLRFAGDKDRAAKALISLCGSSRPAVMPRLPRYAVYHQRFEQVEQRSPRPKTVTATNRGDIAATLVHLYRGGPNEELSRAVDAYAEAACQLAPRFDGTVSLVLDVSGSTQGYGEREYCCVSQSVALHMVLKRCCATLHVHQVGGSGAPPRPEGSTDLASSVLDALADRPDVVMVISDGYENVRAGDLAGVVASLPTAGIAVPIVFCHSKFTEKDDLALRRPAPGLAELQFWHEDDFVDVLHEVFSMAGGDAGKRFVETSLKNVLDQREKEVMPWLTRN